MPQTIHLPLACSTSAPSGLGRSPETRGPWFALYWANPNETTGTRAHDNYLLGPSHHQGRGPPHCWQRPRVRAVFRSISSMVRRKPPSVSYPEMNPIRPCTYAGRPRLFHGRIRMARCRVRPIRAPLEWARELKPPCHAHISTTVRAASGMPAPTSPTATPSAPARAGADWRGNGRRTWVSPQVRTHSNGLVLAKPRRLASRQVHWDALPPDVQPLRAPNFPPRPNGD